MSTPRCILDLRGLALHAYYSDKANLRDTVRNKEGKRIASAAHGVSQFIDIYLLPILREFAPWQIIAAMEGTKAKSRRQSISVGYKEDSSKKPVDEVEDEQKQLCIEGCSRLLLHLGATLAQTPYTEADDTVAYLVERLPGDHTVYTVDQDLLACWRPGVKMLLTDRSIGVPVETYTFQGMDITDPEIGPRMITLWKSLVGDSGDKIKGVPGFGEAAFADLLQAVNWDGMHQLADIVDTKDWELLNAAVQGDPKNKKLAKIAENAEAWRSSWRCAQLHPEWCETNYQSKPVSVKWAKRLPLKENIAKELARFSLQDRLDEFKDFWVNRWLMDQPRLDRMQHSGAYERMKKAMAESEVVGFDWETWDTLKNPAYQEARKGYVDVLNSELTGGSFCFGRNLNQCFYLSVEHRDTANCDKMELAYLLVHLEEAKTEVVAHNSMFESVVAARTMGYRFPLDNLPHDTAVLSSYADENEDTGLKKLAKVWLNYDQTNYSEVVPAGKDMRDISGEEVMSYGCDDSIVACHLFVLFRTIAQCEGTYQFYFDNERHFYEAHIDPFIKGVPVNYERLEELRVEDEQLASQTETRLRSLLAERCSEINEEGFRQVWPEIKTYIESQYLARCAKKDETPSAEALADLWAEAKPEVRQKCAYERFKPPSIDLAAKETVKLLSALSRGLGLASIRTLRPAKLRDWCDSMEQQAEASGTALTSDQAYWIASLRHHADGDSGALQEEAEHWLSKDRSLWVGTELNTGSPNQMAMLFYGILGLPLSIRNDAEEGSARDVFELPGSPATNDLAMSTWLVDLPEDDWRREVITLVQTLRGCKQRNSLYYRPYPLWQSPVDGRIHPQFKNCGTVTRRPSGSAPNLLQVSKIKDDGKVRSCIMPQSYDRPELEPEVIVSIDWAQQEIRIAAATSGDPTLLACYVGDSRLDVHTNTSVAIAKVLLQRQREEPWSYEKFELIRKDKGHAKAPWATEVRNKKGKPTNFLMMYGGSPVGLARKLVVSRELGEAFFEAFFDAYPGLADRQKEVVQFARKHGWSLTMFGNRRHVPHVLSKDRAKAAGAERQVVNMEMQGTAADVCKMTCREWNLQDVPGKTGATLYAFVYDEVVASVPTSKVMTYIDTMMGIMQITLPGTDVVLEAEASFGPSWGKQIELNGDHTHHNITHTLEACQ